MDNAKHAICIPISLSNSLFLEEFPDRSLLPTNLEYETKIQCDSDNQLTTLRENKLDNALLLTSQFSNTPNITEPVSVTTTNVSKFLTPMGKKYPHC